MGINLLVWRTQTFQYNINNKNKINITVNNFNKFVDITLQFVLYYLTKS